MCDIETYTLHTVPNTCVQYVCIYYVCADMNMHACMYMHACMKYITAILTRALWSFTPSQPGDRTLRIVAWMRLVCVGGIYIC